ncbi:hypothetical protein ABIC83_002737 [Roseateles asaccharophilus]|uniref:hypothetical protein n=1 Tax=Roseateles asaccharophilus TaxID=582607 RepID=UPI003833E3C6
MPYTLHPDGCISADTADEFEVLLQRLATPPKHQGPGVSTREHIAAVLGDAAELGLDVGKVVGHGESQATDGAHLVFKADYRVSAAITLLTSVISGPEDGIPATKAQVALGVEDSPKAMGAKLKAIHGVLARLGFDEPEQVVYRRHIRRESPQKGLDSFWMAGPRIREAYQALVKA